MLILSISVLLHIHPRWKSKAWKFICQLNKILLIQFISKILLTKHKNFCWASNIFVLIENWSFHYVLSIYGLLIFCWISKKIAESAKVLFWLKIYPSFISCQFINFCNLPSQQKFCSLSPKKFAESAKFLFWLEIYPSIMSCQLMNFWNSPTQQKFCWLGQKCFDESAKIFFLIENLSFHCILSIYEILKFADSTKVLLTKIFAESAKFLFWLIIDPSIMSCQFMNFWNSLTLFCWLRKKNWLSLQNFHFHWKLIHYVLSI